MSTFHESAARDVAYRWLSTKEGAFALHAIVKGVEDGNLGDESMAVIGNGHWTMGRRWPIEQALMAGIIHVDICAGRIARTKVRTAGTPRADRFRVDNAAALGDLPSPFVAQVDLDQHHSDADGQLAWTEPIKVNVATPEIEDGPGGVPRNIVTEIMIPPGSVPLEIGTTMPSRTLLHIRESRGVARWPYDHEWVTLLCNLGEDFRSVN